MSDSLYHSPPFDFIKNKIFALDDSSDIVSDMPSYNNQNMPQDYNDVEGQNEEKTQEETPQKKYSEVNEKSKNLNQVNGNLFPIAESFSPSIIKNSLSSKNNTNSLLNQKRGNESKNQSNSNKNINGLNQSKTGENKKKGRLTNNSGKEGKHNKFSSDNMIKKSINLSFKTKIDNLNKDCKKYIDIDEELKAKLNKDDKMFLYIKNEFTKQNTKEMMEKNIGEIISEKKIYKNYKNKDEDYNKQSINLIYKISDKGNKEFKKLADFLKTPYRKFWIRFNRFKNYEIDGNNDYLDEVVKMYNEYVKKKFNKKGEKKYYDALINLQKNMCKIFDIK